ncbi:MAG: hypothetical protein LBS62_10605 [Clostridiales bacterium]|jgi:hypothetical protein|nr:hypothetical protein [Clostridiales bacterium]
MFLEVGFGGERQITSPENPTNKGGAKRRFRRVLCGENSEENPTNKGGAFFAAKIPSR